MKWFLCINFQVKVAKFLGITIRHAFADSNSVTVVIQFAEQGSRMIFKTITGFDLLKKKQRLSAATYLSNTQNDIRNPLSLQKGSEIF